jgi:hypothetical protein
MELRRYDVTKPFMVGMLEFKTIDVAVEAAVAASKLKENAFSAQISQPLQKGFASYQGSSVAIAYFRNGLDLNELAADEDGMPDMYVRAQAFRPRGPRP